MNIVPLPKNIFEAVKESGVDRIRIMIEPHYEDFDPSIRLIFSPSTNKCSDSIARLTINWAKESYAYGSNWRRFFDSETLQRQTVFDTDENGDEICYSYNSFPRGVMLLYNIKENTASYQKWVCIRTETAAEKKEMKIAEDYSPSEN